MSYRGKAVWDDDKIESVLEPFCVRKDIDLFTAHPLNLCFVTWADQLVQSSEYQSYYRDKVTEERGITYESFLRKPRDTSSKKTNP